jgi:lysophospholipase L1-like esterase
MTGTKFGGTLAAALLAAAAVAEAPACFAQSGESEALRMTHEERVRDHEDREQQIKKRIAEAAARFRGDVGRAQRPRSGIVSLGAMLRSTDESRARRALGRFHSALESYERGGRRGRFTILQIGDSHTAGDNWTGYLRERFQRRFGDGGRGMLAPGKPFVDFRPYQIRVAQSGNWGNHNYRQWNGTGIASYAIVGDKSGDTIEASMRGLKSFEEIEVEFIRQANGGSLVVNVDGRDVQTISTRGAHSLDRATVRLSRPGHHVTLTLKGDGPVALLSWSLLRRSGLVYVSHGVPGETVGLVGKWDAGIAAWQVHHLDPALIIVAFGTNDGFVNRLKPEEYEAEFRDRLQTIRGMAPNASIAVVTAPGADRLPSWCGRNRAQRERFQCRPLSAAHASNYAELIEKRSRALCYWHSPPALEQVRQIQRRVAERLGVYFWDWSQVTGKDCGMDRWARMDPPLTIPDRVHMRLEGYDLSGEALYRDLTRLYSPGRR